MQAYLNQLLPRIRQFSETLDKKELLIDQPWVLINDDGNKQQYIFERDGKLIMSLNGQVQYGRWRYISAAKSLIIDREKDSLLLNHEFFTDGVCILKRDGNIDKPWMLVNERIVPDLNIKSYLTRLLPENKYLAPLQVKGKNLYFRSPIGFEEPALNNSVIDINDGNEISGVFESILNSKYYSIDHGKIVNIFEKQKFDTDRGKIQIETSWSEGLQKGNSVIPEKGDLADGIYKIKNYNNAIIIVKEGKIEKIKYGKDFWVGFATVVIITAIIIVIIVILHRNQLL